MRCIIQIDDTYKLHLEGEVTRTTEMEGSKSLACCWLVKNIIPRFLHRTFISEHTTYPLHDPSFIQFPPDDKEGTSHSGDKVCWLLAKAK